MPDIEQKYPSVDLAYEWVEKSYNFINERIDIINGRLYELMRFAVTLTLAIPILGKSLGLKLSSLPVTLSLVVFALVVLSCSYGRHLGSVGFLHPGNLFNEHLHKSHWAFRKDLIYWAGQSYDRGMKTIVQKWRMCILGTIFLCLELALVVSWVMEYF